MFDFTGCEGCELQLTNKEETLGAFLDAVEVVNFREASSDEGRRLRSGADRRRHHPPR